MGEEKGIGQGKNMEDRQGNWMVKKKIVREETKWGGERKMGGFKNSTRGNSDYLSQLIRAFGFPFQLPIKKMTQSRPIMANEIKKLMKETKVIEVKDFIKVSDKHNDATATETEAARRPIMSRGKPMTAFAPRTKSLPVGKSRPIVSQELESQLEQGKLFLDLLERKGHDIDKLETVFVENRLQKALTIIGSCKGVADKQDVELTKPHHPPADAPAQEWNWKLPSIVHVLLIMCLSVFCLVGLWSIVKACVYDGGYTQGPITTHICTHVYIHIGQHASNGSQYSNCI
ncbi:hypothetical protein MAR_007170 [Mya arenaria]|uniref:Uncharacterized protein n=1 Tax=Mya arenaria TaxID=6604 RepID=A0ABY7DE57_MYAAR|nr:hypothetical protein MAR_007170 [Mya arenaria]